MAERRASGPYIWVTWLTRLLVGENSCEWAAWFKVQHERRSWTEIPNPFDFTTWQVEHTAFLSEIRAGLEAQGRTVFTENQNSFVLQGKAAALGGKPDLIATSGGTGTILDAKTGRPNAAHHIQVMTYMYAVPRALRQYEGIVFDGRVVYGDQEVDIPSSAVDQKFIDNLAQLIKRLSATAPARKVPSTGECGFCNISKIDCPERAAEDQIEEGATSDF